MTLRSLLSVLLLLLAVGAAGWWLRDVPELQRAWPASWRSVPSPALPALRSAAGADAALRKCLGQGGVTYTNGECPPGTRAEAVAGGMLSVLPAAPAAVAPAAPAEGAQTPLRRLAGPDESAALRERALEQALQR